MMIPISYDESYVSQLDQKAIKKGFAELGVHSLRIIRYYTEEQKQANSALFDRLSKEEWAKNCEDSSREVAAKIEHLVDAISEQDMVYQYKDKSVDYRNDDWDWFFWGSEERDYVTLSTNKKRPNHQQLEDVQRALELIRSLSIDGIQVIVQHTTVYDEKRVAEQVERYCRTHQGRFIEWGGMVGKIVLYQEQYYFKKKNAKKYGYRIALDDRRILSSMFYEMDEEAESGDLFAQVVLEGDQWLGF